jgi:hypothetical protein
MESRSETPYFFTLLLENVERGNQSREIGTQCRHQGKYTLIEPSSQVSMREATNPLTSTRHALVL